MTAVEYLENILHNFIHPEHGAEFFPYVEKAKEMDVEFLPAVAPGDDGKYIGILSVRSAHRRLAAEVLAKQRQADMMYSHGHS